MSRLVFCILGAMIGAGFASGQEIMAIFSCYGSLSWWLIGAAGMIMGLLFYRIMEHGAGPSEGLFPGRQGWVGNGMLLLLLSAAGGGMTAAAGELTALVLPIQYAQGIGSLATLLISLLLSRRPIGPLSFLGKLLIPLLMGAFLLCMRLPPSGIALPEPKPIEGVAAVIRAMGYAGFNALLSAGVLCKAGAACRKQERCRAALWAAGGVMALLVLGNLAFLPRGTSLEKEALPMVMLLRQYGLLGYYLSAVVLLLGIVTTLIAVLQGLQQTLSIRLRHTSCCAFLVCAGMGLLGFEPIVAFAYPAFGLIGMILLILPTKGKHFECLNKKIPAADAAGMQMQNYPRV